jgi:hypothetical protein
MTIVLMGIPLEGSGHRLCARRRAAKEWSAVKRTNHRKPLGTRNRHQSTLSEPIQCIVGDTVCNVRVWSEEEWERLAPADRPTPAEHVPGLGWVGAVLRRAAK